jgi:hypothetical protein
MTRFVRSPVNAVAVLAAFALAGGCGAQKNESDLASISARGTSIDRSRQPLGFETLTSVDGIYGAQCTDRSGAWSAAIDGHTGDLANEALTVVQNDTNCILELTALRVIVDTTETIYLAVPTFDLTADYQTAGSAFRVAPGDGGAAATTFYANALLSSVSFAADFVITVLYSDDPERTTASSTATYSSWSASAVSDLVPAPDYTISMTSLLIQTDVNNVVTDFDQYAQLSAQDQTGEFYVVRANALPETPSYADIHTAFQEGTQAAVPVNLQIPATAFSAVLQGRDLTAGVVGYLIIVHAEDGVPSYQLVTITFHKPN